MLAIHRLPIRLNARDGGPPLPSDGQVDRVRFFTRDSMLWRVYAMAIPSDRHIILVFDHQRLLRKSDGFTPNVGVEYKGVAIFDQYEAIAYI